jgi:hypothetical protein
MYAGIGQKEERKQVLHTLNQNNPNQAYASIFLLSPFRKSYKAKIDKFVDFPT